MPKWRFQVIASLVDLIKWPFIRQLHNCGKYYIWRNSLKSFNGNIWQVVETEHIKDLMKAMNFMFRNWESFFHPLKMSVSVEGSMSVIIQVQLIKLNKYKIKLTRSVFAENLLHVMHSCIRHVHWHYSFDKWITLAH